MFLTSEWKDFAKFSFWAKIELIKFFSYFDFLTFCLISYCFFTNLQEIKQKLPKSEKVKIRKKIDVLNFVPKWKPGKILSFCSQKHPKVCLLTFIGRYEAFRPKFEFWPIWPETGRESIFWPIWLFLPLWVDQNVYFVSQNRRVCKNITFRLI